MSILSSNNISIYSNAVPGLHEYAVKVLTERSAGGPPLIKMPFIQMKDVVAPTSKTHPPEMFIQQKQSPMFVAFYLSPELDWGCEISDYNVRKLKEMIIEKLRSIPIRTHVNDLWHNFKLPGNEDITKDHV